MANILDDNSIMVTVGKKKITSGFVTQTWNEDEDGKHTCVEVEFEAGDPVDYEDEFGETIDEWNEYHPYHMVQPDTAVKLKQALACFEGIKEKLKDARDLEYSLIAIEAEVLTFEGLALLRGIVNG